jgi:hypothetical protein
MKEEQEMPKFSWHDEKILFAVLLLTEQIDNWVVGEWEGMEINAS